MSIGWVMFGKAIVLALWAVIAERWQAAKKRAATNLVLDPATGRYVPDDRLVRIEKWLRRAFYAGLAVMVVVAAGVFWLFIAAARSAG